VDIDLLESTAQSLVRPGRGILAADESAGTCEKRFSAVGIASTEENRRQYRQILVTAPSAETALSGIIFFDETFWQDTDTGETFPRYLVKHGVLPGIKLDLGLQDLQGFDGEKISVGLDTLVDRAQRFSRGGAKFAKWRSVIAIGAGIPTDQCITANSMVLARYARICQDFGIVPIVEPEVLYDGIHSLSECEAVMKRVYEILVSQMNFYRVHLPGVILKTSMVLAGKDSGIFMDHDAVAAATVRALHAYIPVELGGVVFLSGGQKPDDALINLNRIASLGPHPWGVTFSFSRGIQDPVLKIWANDMTDMERPKAVLSEMLAKAVAARDGTLDESSRTDGFVSRSQDL